MNTRHAGPFTETNNKHRHSEEAFPGNPSQGSRRQQTTEPGKPLFHRAHQWGGAKGADKEEQYKPPHHGKEKAAWKVGGEGKRTHYRPESGAVNMDKMEKLKSSPGPCPQHSGAAQGLYFQ